MASHTAEIANGHHNPDVIWGSPFCLADSKRKRFFLGTGIVQFIFGGFLLIPVTFVLSFHAPEALALLTLLTLLGIFGMIIACRIRMTPLLKIDQLQRGKITAPANHLLKFYLVMLLLAVCLGLATLAKGAGLIYSRNFPYIRDQDRKDEEEKRAMHQSDRILFGIGTAVLGAWLTIIQLIMFVMGVHILRKHYHDTAKNFSHSAVLVTVTEPTQTSRGGDREDFYHDELQENGVANGNAHKEMLLTAHSRVADGFEQRVGFPPPYNDDTG